MEQTANKMAAAAATAFLVNDDDDIEYSNNNNNNVISGLISEEDPAVQVVEDTCDVGGEKEEVVEGAVVVPDVESAASKKKKKKKEKEKQKKQLAAAAKEKDDDNETKKNNKKVPKHILDKLEKLAKFNEAQEKKKRDEEERIKKEEEDIRRLEELDRQTQEKKRLKKEKEKAKVLKKKQEGKFLTPKQKEEARRLESMRNHILAAAAAAANNNNTASHVSLPESAAAPHKKKPLYINKKKKSSKPTSTTTTSNDSTSTSSTSSHTTQMNVEEYSSTPQDIITHDDDDDQEEDAVLPNCTTTTKSAENLQLGTKKGATSISPDDNHHVQQQNLRSPICCIMGHVDTGKTKLLDYIRGTNVQQGEAGGITQQIGATYFPAHNIRDRTKQLKADAKLDVPGLLVIDTPGHESFTNLRSRGSGLCDIAILVVDIMHGLEPLTIESLNLLKMRNTEFIIALNKVDRLYGWKTCRNAPITKAIKQQSKDVLLEYNSRLSQVITQFKEQGLNTELYYKNKEMGQTFSIVPTSAISGEGIPDLLLLLVQWSQKTMIERLTFSNKIQCTVLEVKVVEGHGTTIDVVLVNGVLHEGDQIVVCGLQGPIVTSIRALLTPHPMKELRVKGTYLHHKEIKAAQGIKIAAQGLEHAIAGTSLYTVGPNDDLEDIKKTTMEDMTTLMNKIDRSGEGVYVQASTLGSLEALLEFLKSPAVKIPVSGISIGPVHKKDVMKASVMLEKKKEYGTILAFDVKVAQEARELANGLGVRIFTADIIYHLFDQFKAYLDNLNEEKKKGAAEEAVFPCELKIMPNCVFNTKDPIVLGVEIIEGIAKIGTPICVPDREFIEIGRIASIEHNHKPLDYAKKGQKVSIKIIGSNYDEQQKMFGRHFEMEDRLVSKISRNSIDALQKHCAKDLSVEVRKLLCKLKKVFKIT